MLADLIASGRAIIRIRRGAASLAGPVSENQELAAILYHFVVIGEIAEHLGTEFHAAHPSVPWRAVIDHRNVIAHGYDVVDSGLLAETIDRHLPTLVAEAQRILDAFGPPPES